MGSSDHAGAATTRAQEMSSNGCRDQTQISKHVFDERMIEDRKLADDKRDFVAGKFFDQLVAMRMLAVKYGELAPFASGGVEALKFADDPTGFVLFVFQFDDANFFAFLFVGAQNFFREVGAHRVLRDHLRGHAKNIRRGAVIFDERDAEGSRVLHLRASRRNAPEKV